MTRRSRSLPALLIVVVLAALTAVTGPGAGAGTAAATASAATAEAPVALAPTPVEAHTPVTYNMQGGTAGMQDKWNNDVVALTANHDVVVLQESGSQPPGQVQLSQHVAEGLFEYRIWKLGTESRPKDRHIYSLETDANGHRVNLAIVLHQPADDWTTVAPAFPTSRGALGVQVGDMWFYDLHGLSGNGNDTRGLLANIAAASAGSSWAALGDFNRDPGTLRKPRGTAIYASGRSTHQNGGEFDYMVASDVVDCDHGDRTQWMRGARLNGRLSDHYPVDFPVERCPEDEEDEEDLPKPKRIRLMPLGDSITHGIGSSTGNGYRGSLRDRLLDDDDPAATAIDYVGSQRTPQTGDLHEGHPGWTIDQIAELIQPGLPRPGMNPSVITLHIGTNDMNNNDRVVTAQVRLQRLMDAIFDAVPDVTLVMSTLVPARDPVVNERIADYNNKMRDIVADAQSAEGPNRHIVLVDMEDEVQVEDLADDLHPSNTGYDKMARIFDQGVRKALRRGWVADRPEVPDDDPQGDPGPPPGDGTWSDQGLVATGVGADPANTELRFGDLDGDGNKDYLVLDSETGAMRAWVDRGGVPGNWNWEPFGLVATGVARAETVHLADIDGDGMDDYLSVDPATGATRGWINKGGTPDHWNWEPYGLVATGVAPGDQVQFADIDGDRLDDYLVLDPATGAMRAWINQGNGTPDHWNWEPYGLVATGVEVPGSDRPGTTVQFGDINDDGWDDYLTVSPVNGSVDAWLNQGGAPDHWNWTELGQLAPGVGATGVHRRIELAEINDDGRVDYLAVADNGSMHAWLDQGADKTEPWGWLPQGRVAPGIPAGGSLEGQLMADLDGDGRDDYVLVDLQTLAARAWLNKPGEEFGDRPFGSFDPDADNFWDWRPLGQVATGVPTESESTLVYFADIDGDNRDDYLAMDKATGRTRAWINKGGEADRWNWEPFGVVATGVDRPEVVHFADINGDGLEDYLSVQATNGPGHSSVRAWINKGGTPDHWNWEPYGLVATGVGDSGIRVQFGDFDADGMDDYLVKNDDGSMNVWINNGGQPGSWDWRPIGKVASGVDGGTPRREHILSSDMNADGRSDYVVMNHADSRSLRVWHNNGGDRLGQ